LHNASECIAEVVDHLRSINRRIHAFLPERGRLRRLLAEVRAIDDRSVPLEARPPLFGVAVGVKDVFRVDGLPTRAGSRLAPHLFSGPQASVISTLRTAGALILGKTAMDEFAYCEPPLTRNPRNLAHTPGGSSGGSAAAVAAEICPLTLGTQTSRSVIGPAAFCGVVGFKPSYGRIPIDGVIPLAPSFDTVGLLAQNVPTSLLAASVLVPTWQTVTLERRPILGVPEGLFMTWTLEEGAAQFKLQLDRLDRAGYAIRHVQLFTDEELMEIDKCAMGLLHGEMARVHANWFAQYEGLYRPRTANAVRRGQAITDEEIADYQAFRLTFRDRVAQLMQQAGIDMWVCPASAGPAPRGLDQTGWGGMTTAWSYAGMPCLSVPAGLSREGLPLGFQCVAKFGHDELLLQWADDIAKHFDFEPQPAA
jgi:Asp-tRNA(Asn)/Glu-tRNA(Gln) amidotransferase A subunit family amidase